jgi:hypothetical protein
MEIWAGRGLLQTQSADDIQRDAAGDRVSRGLPDRERTAIATMSELLTRQSAFSVARSHGSLHSRYHSGGTETRDVETRGSRRLLADRSRSYLTDDVKKARIRLVAFG